MEILKSVFGAYQTNCYIVKLKNSEIIIDPGEGAFKWVKKNCKNPVAIFNTHGHWDHIYDNAKIKNFYQIPLYIPKQDAFMLKLDDSIYCEADFLVEPDMKFQIDEAKIEFMHFPGHTPGCSMIKIEDVIFSGDFLFYNSIGRYDFPYSNKTQMIKSIKKCLEIQGDFPLYPGHGKDTNLVKEKENLKEILRYIRH